MIDPKLVDDPEEPPQRLKPFQPPVFARPILSTQDTYDQNTQVESLTDPFQPGVRPLWNVPNQAVTAVKVTTIKTSANVQSLSPAVPVLSGAFLSPNTNLTTFTVVPNMAQTIKASGPVQVSFVLNAQTVNAADTCTFAIFRNGVQVSQAMKASGPAANTSFSVQGTYTDNPPLGYQVYDVRWAKGSSLLTATGKQRTLQVLNLRAQ